MQGRTHGGDALVVRVLCIVLLPEFRPAVQTNVKTRYTEGGNPQNLQEKQITDLEI